MANNKDFSTNEKRKKAIRQIFMGVDGKNFEPFTKTLQNLTETVKGSPVLPPAKKIIFQYLGTKISDFLKIQTSKKESEKFSELPTKKDLKSRFNKIQKSDYRTHPPFGRKFPTPLLSFPNLMSNLSALIPSHQPENNLYPNSLLQNPLTKANFQPQPSTSPIDLPEKKNIWATPSKPIVIKNIKNSTDMNNLFDLIQNSSLISVFTKKIKEGKKGKIGEIDICDLEDGVEEIGIGSDEEMAVEPEWYRGGDNELFPSLVNSCQKIYFESVKGLVKEINSVVSYPNKNQIGILNIHSGVGKELGAGKISSMPPLKVGFESTGDIGGGVAEDSGINSKKTGGLDTSGVSEKGLETSLNTTQSS
jgi:hypothetical protein